MGCFAVKFILCRSPEMSHCIDKIKAYDMGDATTHFFKIIRTNLGLHTNEVQIKDIREMK